LDVFNYVRSITNPIFSDVCTDQVLWDHFISYLGALSTEEYLYLYKEIVIYRNIVGKEDLKTSAREIFLKYFGNWDKGEDFYVSIGDMKKLGDIKKNILDDKISPGLFDCVYVDIFSMLKFCFNLFLSGDRWIVDM